MRFSAVNGRPLDVCSIRDRGLQFGDGLFETMLCLEGEAQGFDRHWSRLTRGCASLGIECPDVRAAVAAAIREVGRPRAVAKLVVTRGTSQRGYRCPPGTAPTWILTIDDAPSFPAARYQSGVEVKLCRTRLSVEDPRLAGLKHLNRLPQVLARGEWDDEYHEGLLADPAGHLVEGCSSNFFLVRETGLITPDLGSCGVRGVVRERVLEHAERSGIPCRVGPVTTGDLATAAEVFLTNAVLGIVPVRSIEQQQYPVGALTRRLMNDLCRGVHF